MMISSTSSMEMIPGIMQNQSVLRNIARSF